MPAQTMSLMSRNDANACHIMMDDYEGPPEYSSRRSSYNNAVSESSQSNLHLGPYSRNPSLVSDRSTATKTIEEYPPSVLQGTRAHSNSDSSLPFTKDDPSRCSSRKVIKTIALLTTLFAGVIFIIGVCFLVFSSGDTIHNPLKPLGYFLFLLGILIALITISIIFSPSDKSEKNVNKAVRQSNSNYQNGRIAMMEPSNEMYSNGTRMNAPEITVTTANSAISKFPIPRPSLSFNSIDDKQSDKK